MRLVRIVVLLIILAVCGSARPAWAQAHGRHHSPDFDSYWQRRRAIAIGVSIDLHGKVEDARPLLVEGTRAQADSLLEIVKAWRVPLPGGPPYWRPGEEGYVTFVMDRREKLWQGAVGPGLPSSVKRIARRGVLATWLRAWRTCDPQLSIEDFISCGWEWMPEARTPGLDMLHTGEMQKRRRLGLLLPSPHHRWVLDPFAGFEVDASGNFGADVDRGWDLFDAKTGERTYHWVTTTTSIEYPTWLDDTHFLIAGTSKLDAPSRSPVWTRLTAMWIADVSTGKIEWFLGAPIETPEQAMAYGRIARLRQDLYPKVAWP